MLNDYFINTREKGITIAHLADLWDAKCGN